MNDAVVSEFLRERLHDRRFRVVDNAHGLSNGETLFHYRVTDTGIAGSYQGGHIANGQVVGRALGSTSIELLYHCLTTDGELLAGWSKGTVGVDPQGRTTLSFIWGWLAGADGGGESHYVEITG